MADYRGKNELARIQHESVKRYVSMDEKVCETCVFSDYHENGSGQMLCCFLPPVPIGTTRGIQHVRPHVSVGETCSKWQREVWR